MGINPNQISTTDTTGLAATEGSVILSKNNGENTWTSNSTASLIIPVGTVAQRDSASTGRIRFNTETSTPELTFNNTWKSYGQMNIAGTIANPGIAFSLDATTGLTWQGSPTKLSLVVQSSERASWTSSLMTVSTSMSVVGDTTTRGLILSGWTGNTVGITVNRPGNTAATFLYSESTQSWSAAIGATGLRIKSSAAPVDADDLANKAYVDSALAGSSIATTTNYGTVKLATLPQAISGASGVVATTDIARSALNSVLDSRFGVNNSLVWNANNDGSGSGLDADLLDGQHGTYYATAASVTGKVNITGDTMTGFLTLNANPTATLHAATKQYVDTKLALSGGTLTGPLILSADPSSALQAATKQYVDARVARSGDTMTGYLTLNGNPVNPLHAATKDYADAVSNSANILAKLLAVDGAGSGLDSDLLDGQQGSYYAPASTVNGKVNRTGDTMTGSLTINAGDGLISLSTNGDITARRADGTGVIFLGSSGSKYLYHDNTNYVMPTSNLYINGGLAWTSVNDGHGSGLDADTLDGLHASQFINSANFGSNSLGQNGYQVFPNGLIHQWGYAGGTNTYIAFPLAFPNACLTVYASNANQQGNAVDNSFAYVYSTAYFYIASKASTSNTVTGYPAYWFAIGY